MARRGSNMMGRTRFEDQGVTALFESLSFASAQPEDHSGRQARKGRDPVVVPTFPEDRTSEGSEETVTVSHRTLVPQACSESQQPLGDTDQIREEAVRGQLDKDVLHVDPTGRDGETGSCSQKDEGLMAAARPTTMPRFPSLDMNSPNAVCTPSSSSEYSGGNISSEHSVTSSDPVVDLGKGSFANMGGVVQLRQCADAQQGFLPRSPKDLQEFLMQISYCQRDFGIFVTDILTPSCVDGKMCYRPEKEYEILKDIHHTENIGCGVYLCRDKCTGCRFVMKRISKKHHRLTGLEFLTQHNKDFLLKIYGVYKETDTICIFEEYIKGGTLLQCDWNLQKVRKFAEVLLTSFRYLHDHDLAHCDVKLMNLMVRDREDPTSLVIIDFESAKHPQYHFHKGGHTLTYLPPWYDLVLDLSSYDQVLKTADLWAIACVLLFFLMPSDHHDLRKQGRVVWGKFMDELQSKCNTCRQDPHSKKYCEQCKKDFKHHIKGNGHLILQDHLGHLMNSSIDDPDWIALKKLLQYLTDTRNVRQKNISVALSIITGDRRQPDSMEHDYNVKIRT